MQKSPEQSRDISEEGDILVFDTGAGSNGNITIIEWHVF